jgi:hypothetical protein
VASGEAKWPSVAIRRGRVARVVDKALRIIEEIVWSPSQRPTCNESQETKFRTASTVPNDNELPPNFAHSAGGYRERRERASAMDQRPGVKTTENAQRRWSETHFGKLRTLTGISPPHLWIDIPALNQIVI